jgi:hypothetical protein
MIDAETHAEELGMCVECSNDYYTNDCETCGEFIDGGNPFSRYCDKCLDEQEIE